MVGKMAGVLAHIKALVLSFSSSHCVLPSKSTSGGNNASQSEKLLGDTMKTVNHVKSKPLNVRLFKIICEEMGSEHTSLAAHRRWPSRGKVLVWVFELCTELPAFFVEHPFHLSHSYQALHGYESWHTLRTFSRRSLN
jgi:hypothetical protein